MPRYFFHLRFGRRFLPDDEGIELRNRTAARDEALTVVRDLTNKVGRQRWASWFLEVADDRSGFFRTPIGHPSLELVTPDRHAPGGAEPELRLVRAKNALPEEAHAGGRTREIVRQRAALHQRRAQLLKENHQLQSELLSLRLDTEALLARTQRLVSVARGPVAPLLAASVMTTAQTGTLLSTVCLI